MVLDTSALVAILPDEPERRTFNEAIEAADSCRVSAATFVESSIVAGVKRKFH
jgi:ribonuclease VapC